MKDFHVPKSACPSCGHVMDMASPLTPGTKPDVDCFGLCIRYGELACFDPDLRLRKLEPEDLLSLTEGERRYLIRLQAETQRFLRERQEKRT